MNDTTMINVKTDTTSWRDYYILTKPKVVMLMLLTSVGGMFLAIPGMVPLNILILGNLGIALCAGSAAAINQLLDKEADKDMARTHNRPLPKGKLQPKQVIVFALVIGLLGMTILLVGVNPLTAWLTLASLIGYAFIYTLFLKHATPQNIVIGGLAGAAPPLLGWTAVTNHVDGNALILVLIIFAWTPPHFWALALHRKEEYAKVNIPMLPVTHGEGFTRVHILLYTLILFAVTLLPFVTRMSGMVYLVGVALLNIGFLYWAVLLLFNHHPLTAIKTFRYSIIYLMALFVVLLVDHYNLFSLFVK